jgi:hypothetical protein
MNNKGDICEKGCTLYMPRRKIWKGDGSMRSASQLWAMSRTNRGTNKGYGVIGTLKLVGIHIQALEASRARNSIHYVRLDNEVHTA